VQTGYTTWSGGGSFSPVALNGVASVAAAHAMCSVPRIPAYTPEQIANCQASYGANAVISSIDIDNRDAQGRSYRAGYSAPSAAAASGASSNTRKR
jgi:hypothetical protein